VFYRGRIYNVFTLVTADDSGLGKIRQLIGSLVQRNTVAYVPLLCSSCLYLLPKCDLTENKLGLRVVDPDSDISKRNEYLYAVIVTPKSLSTKVNGEAFFCDSSVIMPVPCVGKILS